MITFTLDTNCIVDVDEGRAQMPHVLRLVAAHEEGRAHVVLSRPALPRGSGRAPSSTTSVSFRRGFRS